MEQATLPKVSIIIPFVENRGWLDQALNSIETQDYPSELIEVLLERSPNTVGYNINRGIDRATGKYIKYFAEDDYLEPTCISASVAFLESTPYRWMHANSFIIHEGVNEQGKPVPKGMHIPPFNPNIEQLRTYNHIHGGTVMYERSLFKEVCFDETLRTGEEYDLYLQLYSKGITPGYLDEFIFNYRRHPGQKSLGNTDPQYQQWRREVINQIKNRYK